MQKEKKCNSFGCNKKAEYFCRACGIPMCKSCKDTHHQSCPKDLPIIRKLKSD